MRNNKSTPAQRRYIESLCKGRSTEEIIELLKPAFAINSNAPWDGISTLNQALTRLTKTAASRAIDILKNN